MKNAALFPVLLFLLASCATFVTAPPATSLKEARNKTDAERLFFAIYDSLYGNPDKIASYLIKRGFICTRPTGKDSDTQYPPNACSYMKCQKGIRKDAREVSIGFKKYSEEILRKTPALRKVEKRRADIIIYTGLCYTITNENEYVRGLIKRSNHLIEVTE